MLNRFRFWLLNQACKFFRISSNWPIRCFADNRPEGEWLAFHKGKWVAAPEPPMIYDATTRQFFTTNHKYECTTSRHLREMEYYEDYFLALDAGENAFRNNIKPEDNPHEEGSAYAEAWDNGWHILHSKTVLTGIGAYMTNVKYSDNPHQSNTQKAYAWNNGWFAGLGAMAYFIHNEGKLNVS